MQRALAYAVLSLLLLAMQYQGQVHALAHTGTQLARTHDAALAVPGADGTCLECTLLAGGASVAHGEPAQHAGRLPATAQPAWIAVRSRTTPAPVYFSSRAPPLPL
jgi:hypothetical protein